MIDRVEAERKRNMSIENIRKLKASYLGAKEVIVILFFLCFIASICYWFYQLYLIETNSFDNLTTDVELLKAAAHEEIAFQAIIVSFLVCIGLTYVI